MLLETKFRVVCLIYTQLREHTGASASRCLLLLEFPTRPKESLGRGREHPQTSEAQPPLRPGPPTPAGLGGVAAHLGRWRWTRSGGAPAAGSSARWSVGCRWSRGPPALCSAPPSAPSWGGCRAPATPARGAAPRRRPAGSSGGGGSSTAGPAASPGRTRGRRRGPPAAPAAAPPGRATPTWSRERARRSGRQNRPRPSRPGRAPAAAPPVGPGGPRQAPPRRAPASSGGSAAPPWTSPSPAPLRSGSLGRRAGRRGPRGGPAQAPARPRWGERGGSAREPPSGGRGSAPSFLRLPSRPLLSAWKLTGLLAELGCSSLAG